jgi:hypothetical protein
MVFTNRYFEFVQGDDFIDMGQLSQSDMTKSKNETSKLLSAFDQLRDRTKFLNKAFNSDKFREMQPKELSHGRKGKLWLDPRSLSYWEEYFGQFDIPAPVDPPGVIASTAFSKSEKLH